MLAFWKMGDCEEEEGGGRRGLTLSLGWRCAASSDDGGIWVSLLTDRA